jgi:hypothetical protein
MSNTKESSKKLQKETPEESDNQNYPELELELVKEPKIKTIQDLIVEYTLLGSRCDLILHKIKMKKLFK